MKKYEAKVKWNGNHYFAGETVRGSDIKVEDDGTYLFDDEESNEFPFVPRNEWVLIDSNTLIELEGN